MSAFNRLLVDTTCPRCGRAIRRAFQFKWGATWQYDYLPGESLRWGGNDIGTPGLARTVVEAWPEACTACGWDEDATYDLVIEFDVTRSVAGPRLPPLPSEPVEPFFWPASDGDTLPAGRVVGRDLGRSFVEGADGSILAVVPSSEAAAWFVNSSEGHFAAFLAWLPLARAGLAGLDDVAAGAAVDELQERLAAVDGAAFDGPDTHWSMVLEQLRDGLL